MPRALKVAAVLVALLALAVGVAIPIAIQRNLTVEGVERRGSELAGRPVTVEAVHIAFVPALRIRAEGIAVEGAGSVDAVEVEIALVPLLRRRVEPSELHLRGPHLLLERAADGSLRLRLLHPPGGDPGATGGPRVAALPAVDARDGEFVVVEADGSPSTGPRLRIRRLELDRLRRDARTPLRLELAVEPGEDGRVGVGALELAGFLEIDDDELQLTSGRFEGRDLLARGLRFPGFDGRFEYAGGRVAIEHASLSGYGGTLALAGSLETGSPARYRGRIDVSKLDVGDLLADWRGQPQPHEYGTLAGGGELDFRLRAREQATGAGTLELRGGTLPAGSLFSALLGGIGRLTGSVFSLGGAVAPSRSKVERASASWELRGGRLHSEDLSLETDDYRYDAVGSLGLDQTLAFSGPLQLTSRGLQRMVAMAALPLPAATAVIPAIPVDVGGRLGAVEVSARATALPSAAASVLTGLVRGGGSVVKDAAEGGKKIVDKVFGQ